MALNPKTARTETTSEQIAPVWQQLLVIPEATLLLALLLIGWAFHFPVVISLLIMVVIGAFVLRLWLIATAAQQLRRGAYGRADKLVRVALRLNPWSVDALQLRAEGFVLQGDDERAEQVLRRAVRLAPHQHAVHSTLTATLLAQGSVSEAHTILEQVQPPVGQPLTPQVLHQMAWYALHIESKPVTARGMLAENLILDLPAPTAAPLLVTLAEAQLALHDVGAAQGTVRAISERLPHCTQPQQAELHYHLGRLHAALGGEAQTHFRLSVALDPQGRHAHSAWRGAIGYE